MVAMRVWTKCMKSVAISAVQAAGTVLPPKSFLARIYSSGSISTPKSVPEKRQPKGVMPKSATPRPMIVLPSGGCVIS